LQTFKGIGVGRTAALGAGVLVSVTVVIALLCRTGWISGHRQEAQDYRTAQEASPTSKQEDFDLSGWKPANAIDRYTLLLAGFTGLLVLISVWQGYFLLRADKTARGAADAATKAAEAADLNARAAIGVELPRLELFRASWGSGVMSAVDKLQGGNLTVILRNYGRTGAHIIEDCITADIPEYDFMPDDPTYPVFGVEKAEIGKVIEPTEGHLIFGQGKLTILPSQADSVLRGEKTLYVYGYVKYRDFLGDTWRSKFCLTLNDKWQLLESTTWPNYSGRSRFNAKAPDDMYYGV
jgi:hypothetical protein